MNRSTVSRMHKMRGPSFGRHALFALLVLLAIPALTFGFYKARGHESDAIPRGEIALTPSPEAPSPYNLATARSNLPDLLDTEDVANVSVVANVQNPQRSDDDLAGAQPPSSEPTILQSSSAPKTILIDGRPLGSGPAVLTTPQNSSAQQTLQALTQTGPLARAPISGLTRSSPYGQIPAPNASGLAPMTAYARPYKAPTKSKAVALVLGGLGVNQTQTRRAIDLLPPEVTLSFAAHVPGLQNWVNQARAKGHEVILELPMEPYNFENTGQGTQHVLRSDVNESENIRNLDYLLSRAQGYFAVTNYLGEKILNTPRALTPVIDHIEAAGLGFIYDGIGQNRSFMAAADTSQLEWMQIRSLIDVNADIASTKNVLGALESSARSGEIALGVGFSHASTIDAIIEWSEELSVRGVLLAPASAAFPKR